MKTFIYIIVISTSIILCQAKEVLFSSDYPNTINVLDYFPAQIGSSWVYDFEQCEYNAGSTDCTYWTRIVSVVDHIQLSEGLLIYTSIEDHDGFLISAPDSQKVILPDNHQKYGYIKYHYLIRGNYVYEVSHNRYDQEQQLIDPFFYTRLAEGDLEPIFFFPTDKARHWGSANQEKLIKKADEKWRKGEGPIPDAFWIWNRVDQGTVTTPAGQFDDTFTMKNQYNGGYNLMIIKPEIGLIQWELRHPRGYIIYTLSSYSLIKND